MKRFQLKAEVRQDLWKKASKEYRQKGIVPVVLYGGSENHNLFVHEADIRNLI